MTAHFHITVDLQPFAEVRGGEQKRYANELLAMFGFHPGVRVPDYQRTFRVTADQLGSFTYLHNKSAPPNAVKQLDMRRVSSDSFCKNDVIDLTQNETPYGAGQQAEPVPDPNDEIVRLANRLRSVRELLRRYERGDTPIIEGVLVDATALIALLNSEAVSAHAALDQAVNPQPPLHDLAQGLWIKHLTPFDSGGYITASGALRYIAKVFKGRGSLARARKRATETGLTWEGI